MNPRTTGILLLLALGLGAFVYFYEIEGEGERLEAEQAAKRLFPGIEAEAIDWLAVTTSDGQAARFEQRDGDWRLTEPLEFPADAAVRSMAQALAELTSEAVYEEPQPLAEYGLEASDAKVVRFGVGESEHTLRLGRDTPVGSNAYAWTGASDAVYTVEGSRKQSFDRSLDDLREKRVLDFDRSAIREVEARWPGGRVVLARNDDASTGAWRVTAPIQGRADDQAVEALLSTLTYLRADGFVDAPSEADDASLSPPAFEVALVPEGEDPTPVVMAVGELSDAGDRRVRAGGASLYRIPNERLSDFPRELVAYRYKQLASFRMTDAQQVDFFFQPASGDPVLLTANRIEGGWESTPESFAPGKLSRIVSELSRLHATDILAEEMGEEELAALGLSPPTSIVSVFGAVPETPGQEEAAGAETEGAEGEAGDAATAPRLAEIHIGHLDSAHGIVARAAGDPTVYRLDLDLAEHLPVSLEAFRNRFQATETPEDILPEPALPDEDDPLSAGEESP